MLRPFRTDDANRLPLAGNISDLVLNSAFFGMENRLAGSLQVSRNEIQFGQEGNPDTFPADTLSRRLRLCSPQPSRDQAAPNTPSRPRVGIDADPAGSDDVG